MKRRTLAALAVALVCPVVATAQDGYPERPIKLVVPFSAGGPVDAVARLVGEAMARHLGQPVVVENRTGGSGLIGSEYVAAAPADGYTLLMGNNTTHTLPSVFRNRPSYKPNAMAPIGLVGYAQTVLMISARLPVNTYEEFVRHARSHPGKLSYASAGNGTGSHVASEWFKEETRTFMVHIPYRGTGQAMSDLVSGQIDMMFDSVITALPQAQAGRVKIVAVASRSPIPALKDVRTLQELGLKNFDASMWVGLFAPGGTPAAITRRLNDALEKALRDPQVVARLGSAGIASGGGGPEVLADHMQTIEAATAAIVRSRNLRPE